jgi:hypothetical protein
MSTRALLHNSAALFKARDAQKEAEVCLWSNIVIARGSKTNGRLDSFIITVAFFKLKP